MSTVSWRRYKNKFHVIYIRMTEGSCRVASTLALVFGKLRLQEGPRGRV
jgi:hypothetical protein